ncbi:potassium channel protein [Luminiphilus syltensis NOR5-1B]|uniref:Potassium channel protein n=1 Tax=Luminiphilus syltensis NOR5-1B TaxID=565045 RepID=B8KS86_9GAMM|nr:ion transporter [Luminiphilus syltensis]EED35875.1 potassium channel protein [Luminiphilus syltensis NOR5-1B]
MTDEHATIRRRTEIIIFGTETGPGRTFDVLLILAILMSVGAVMLDSMASIHQVHGTLLRNLELIFTLLFTVEYVVRIWCVQNRLSYIFSFWGVIDFLSLLPTYLAILIPETAPLLIIRLLRVMRTFRVLRLFELMNEFNDLVGVLRSTSRSILVFFSLVFVIIVVFASALYVVEGPEHGFTSIPLSIYWAVVTITTVGYGDITPQTPLGKTFASMGMLIGYSILAVPTAIVTTKLWERMNRRNSQFLQWNCPVCAKTGHALDACFCKHCGAELDVPAEIRSANGSEESK